MRRFFCLLAVLLVCSASVWAYNDLVEGSVTNIVNRDIWTNAIDITVGDATTNNLLIVESYVSNRNVRVGVQAGASNNAVIVDSTGWDLAGDFTVGATGSVNRLEILGNADVVAENVHVGATTNSVNNTVLVAGSGSSLTVRDTLYVGSDGNSGNSVTVTNGALVNTSNLLITNGNFNLERDGTLWVDMLDASQTGFNWEDGGTLEVTGELSEINSIAKNEQFFKLRDGGSWNTRLNTFSVGGSSNQVNFTTGAQLTSSGGILAGTNNFMSVEGDGTTWNSSNAILIGGVSNRLDVYGGARINSDSTTVGLAGSSNNIVVIDGSDTVWSNFNDVAFGADGVSNFVQISSGALLSSQNGTVGGSGTSNVVLVSGTDSTWNLESTNLNVTGDGNELRVSSGGRVYLGNQAEAGASDYFSGAIVVAADSNAVMQIDDGGRALVIGKVVAGVAGSGDGKVVVTNNGTLSAYEIEIADGSSIDIDRGGTLEMLIGFNSNVEGLNWNAGGQVLISGGNYITGTETNLTGEYFTLFTGTERILSINQGASWNNSGNELAFGVDGDGNRLIVTNSGFVLTDHAYVGYGREDTNGVWIASDNNSVLVTDAGSQFRASDTLYVGWSNSSDNAFTISNGGFVLADNAYVGHGANNNTLLVTGTNSTFELDDTLYVGWNGSAGNAVTVTNGGVVMAENLDVASNNTFYIQTGGKLQIEKDFNIDSEDGLDWKTGELEVHGELTWSGSLDGTNQILTLEGNGAAWNNAGNNFVGTSGSSNQLSILDGAIVSNLNATVGEQDTSFSNQVIVSGSGSRWVNDGTLTIGTAVNSNNAVTVDNEAIVEVNGPLTIIGNNDFNLNNDGTLDISGVFNASANGFNWNEGSTLIARSNLTGVASNDGTNRTLKVDGGTLDETGNTLYWGKEGSGNTLSVLNTGTVFAADTYIGYGANANNNSATLSGDQSTWTSTGDLVIGFKGSDNTFTVANSGTVYSVQGFIGLESGADNNAVTVKGTNSSWNAGTFLRVGGAGTGNKLRIEDHGLVENDLAFVGGRGDNNSVVVTGDGSLWINEDLYVGSITKQFGTLTNIENDTVTNFIPVTNTFTSSGNSVAVENGGRVETETLTIIEGNTFNLNSGGTLHIDATSSFTITNEQYEGLNWNNGGNLSLSGELLGMATTNLVVDSGTTNSFGFLDNGRHLTLDGSSAVWNNDNLIMGYGGGSTILTLADGGSAQQTNTYIGWQNSGGNAVVVETNSVMSSLGNLYLGQYRDVNGNLQNAEAGNSLSVSNGGWVLVGDVLSSEFTPADSGIAVAATGGAKMIVDNQSSVLSEGGLWVGLSSVRTGMVTVANGSLVQVASLTVQDDSEFNLNSGGTLFVTEGTYDVDAQSNVKWRNGGHLAIGGTLTGYDGGMRGTNQILSIIGSNAVWNLGTKDMFIGAGAQLEADGNVLQILDGGEVTNANAYVGSESWSYDNKVLVSGSNSLWRVTDTLFVGDGTNKGNQVTVGSGGMIQADLLDIATNNSATKLIIESGGTLEMQGGFNVSASEHQGLDWKAGGTLAVKGTLTGMPETNLFNGVAEYLSDGKYLTLNGGKWNADTNNLIVGYSVNSSFMTVTNGAKVTSQNGYIGWGSSHNRVLISDDRSVWSNMDGLYVGAIPNETTGAIQTTGTGNSLTVTNGGWALVGNFNTNTLAGGIGVVGTNIIGNGATVVVDEGFYVNNADSTSASLASIYSGGSLTANNVELRTNSTFNLGGSLETAGLSFETASTFNLEGSLKLTGDFNADQGGVFNWNDGASLEITNGSLSGIAALTGENKSLVINHSGWTNSGAFTLSGINNSISLINTGEVESASLIVGSSAADSGLSVSIANSGSVWTVTGDVVEGAGGSSNHVLSVTDNGTLDIGGDFTLLNGSLFSLSTNATVLVGGDMMITNSFVVGSGTVGFSASDNLLSIVGSDIFLSPNVVFDGGVGNDRVVLNGGTYAVSDNSTDRYENFEELQLINSTLTGDGTVDSFNLVKIEGGIISPRKEGPDGGQIFINTSVELLNKPTLDVNVKGSAARSGADQLKVRGNLDNVSMKANIAVANNITDVENMGAVILVSSDGGLANVFAAEDIHFDEHYLFFNFMLTNSSPTEIKVISEVVPGSDLSSTLTFAGMRGVRAAYNGMQSTVHNRTRQLGRNLVATAHAIPHEAYLLSSPNEPKGTKGPGDNNTIFGMNVWADQFGGRGEYDRLGNSDAFTIDYYGTTFGLDQLFGESLLAGIYYTYVRSDADADNGDAANTENYWFGLYGEWVGEQGFFVDAMASVGQTDYETLRTAQSYRGTGSFEGMNYAAYVDVGNYFHYKNWALAPYAGLHSLRIESDSFIETDTTGNAFQVSGMDVSSLESVVGLKVRSRFDTRAGRFQTVGFVEWDHDWINEDVDSTYTLGNTSVTTATITPDEDLINAGVGVSWMCTDQLSIGLGYDARFNEDYEEHTGTAKLNVMF